MVVNEKMLLAKGATKRPHGLATLRKQQCLPWSKLNSFSNAKDLAPGLAPVTLAMSGVYPTKFSDFFEF